MTDYQVLIIESLLLSVIVGASIVYLRQIRRGRREYKQAKHAVEDIVLSFNRQFRRIAERLETVAYKVEANSSKSEKALARTGEIQSHLPIIETQLSTVFTGKQAIENQLVELNRAFNELKVSQEALTSKVADIMDRSKQSSLADAGLETAIPIRREKALSPLTETELRALELLAAEGAKTAPEIKWRIKLSREHTARLMKKLYEEGYLERDPSKIPFKYSVKKEMEKFLKKPESNTAS